MEGTPNDSFSAAASTNLKQVFTQRENENVPSQGLKWPILSLPQLKVDPIGENGSEMKSWCEDRKVADFYLNHDGKECCSDDGVIESAPKEIKNKNEKEEVLDQKNIGKEIDYDAIELCAIKREADDVNELTAEELKYSRESPIKSEFIEQKALHIKDEANNEDILKNEKNCDSLSPFIQPETVHQDELQLKNTNKKLNKKIRKPRNQLMLHHQCLQCPYKTPYKHNLKSHSIKHKKPDEIEWYICQECPYKTPKKKNLKKHAEIHNSLMLKCSKCSYETLRPTSLKNHQIEHKSNVSWLYCPECSFKTHVPYRLRYHVLAHKSDAFKCTECSYQSKTKQQLTLHQAKHEPMDKWHLCPLCPFKTHARNTLVGHCRRCHSIDPNSPNKQFVMFKCPECSFESGYKCYLKRHQLIHDQNSWHQCSDCAYKTPEKCELKKHQIRHHGKNAEGWHKCLNCPYKTTRKPDLLKHILRHKSTDQIRQLKCSQCSFKTVHKYSLSLHKLQHKEVHEIEWFYCYECGYKTRYKSNLVMHISRHKDYLENSRK